MAFSISFLDVPPEFLDDDPSIASAIGKLVIGEFEEDFVSSLFEWGKRDYEAQWNHAVKTLLDGGSKAALIVEFISPQTSNNLSWWKMYRIGESVYIQSQILFFDQLREPFSLDRAFSFIADYRERNEDGLPISTWKTTLAEIREFARF